MVRHATDVKFRMNQLKSEKMKLSNLKIIFAAMSVMIFVLLMFISQSCSKNNDEVSLTMAQLNEKEMLSLASKHLINTNNIFSLDINKQEAIKLGISSKYYDKMLLDITKTNAEIKRILKNNGIILGLNKQGESNVELQNVRFKASGTETGQTINSKYKTSITASDNAPVSANVGTVNAKYIEFKVVSGCLVTAVTISVNTGSGISQVTIMSYPFSSGTARIDLPTTSSNCTVSIMTPCSDGATVGVYFGQ